ncbi:MAG TPA: hypothetical protein DEG43_02100 [Acidimicrobiaceae bacterium]|jgi:hypothetical protein|nr:hypothetical protein [Acidimicrobiaceae bacterium]
MRSTALAPKPDALVLRWRRIGVAMLLPLFAAHTACGPDAEIAAEPDTSTTSLPAPSAPVVTVPGELPAEQALPSDQTSVPTPLPSPPIDPSTADPTNPPKDGQTGAAPSTTALLPAGVGLPEVLAINSQGQNVTLDETALLACSKAQYSWVASEQGKISDAKAEVRIAAMRAESSAVAEISGFAPQLQQASESKDPQPVAKAFVELCSARGFEY